MLEAIKNNDVTFRFTEGTKSKTNYLFNYTLNRIKEMIETEKLNARESEKYFEVMLNSVASGIFTIDEKGNVLFCNKSAKELLGLSVLTHIDQLSKVENSFPTVVNNLDNLDTEIISFFNERGTIKLSLNSTNISIKNKDLKIVVLNDITEEFKDQEFSSNTKMVGVLTHEILNQIVPISSLSDTLLDINKDKNVEKGLKIIKTTSDSLVSFVNSYRKLTKIPLPNKDVILLENLINKVLTLIKKQVDIKNIDIEVNNKVSNIMIYADEGQITQVLINILKNAINAVLDKEKKEKDYLPKIWIENNIESNEDITISISNNGYPIPADDQLHVFTPFFTTTESGTGIGLSICHQIMKLNNGIIKLEESNDFKTTFKLIFK